MTETERNAVIEECARVADAQAAEYAATWERHKTGAGHRQIAENVGALIRNLKQSWPHYGDGIGFGKGTTKDTL